MKRKNANSTRVPVYRDAGFELSDALTTLDAFTKEAGNERDPDIYIYSRYRNPTVVAAEEEIMKLEGSEWALLAQSGMAAVDIAVSVFQKGETRKPWLFFSEIYGGTISFAEMILKKRRGLDIHYFEPENEKYDIVKFEATLKKLKPEFVYIEAIANPMLIVPDAEEIIRLSKKSGAKVLVDNTFATPALWKPLDSGADIVIHSATKYFSGHGNITAGVLCGNDDSIMREAVEYRKFAGHMLSADDAYRLHTQIQTFGLRFRKQCENAALIAALLREHEAIENVWYPGLSDHPTNAEAVKLFKNNGFGGMITFEFGGRNDDQKRDRRDIFIEKIYPEIRIVPSLGDPATIIMPVQSVWGQKYPRPGMIRMSAGIEEADHICSIIRRGLSEIS